MPNELTRLYQQMRGGGAPSPEEWAAVQREEIRRAMGGRMAEHPVNLIEAVGQGLKEYGQGWKESLAQRGQEVQEMLGQDVAGPDEGMVSIPEAVRRRGTSPMQGVAAMGMGPAGLPYLASPSVQKGIDIGSQFMPAVGALELTPELLMDLIEDGKKLHGAAFGLANKYVKSKGNVEAVALSLKDEGNQALTEAWLSAKEAGKFGPNGDPVVPFESMDEFFDEVIYPRLQKIVNKLKAEENPLIPIATSKGEEVVDEGMEAARKGSSILDRMGEATVGDAISIVERKNLIPKDSLEERIVRKVLLQGDSPTRAMIDAGKGQYLTANSGKLIPTGNKQRYVEVPLERVKEALKQANISAKSLKPSVLLQKQWIKQDKVMDVIDQIVENPPPHVNWQRYRKAAYSYLIDGKSPQQVIRTLPGRSPHKRMSLAEERNAKRHLEAITSRVLKHFGVRWDIEDVNKLMGKVE